MKEKIKIGMITDNFLPTRNGVAKVSDALTEALSRNEDVEQIYLGCPSGFGAMQFSYNVVPCKATHLPIVGDGFSFVAFDRKYRKFIKETDVDIYHCQTISTLFSYTRKIAKKRHKPLIVTVHTLYHNDIKMYVKFNFLAKFITKIVTRIFNKADEVWTLNAGVKEYLINLGINADKIRILNNGRSPKKVENISERKERFNAKYQIDENMPVFCFVGRLFKYKNLFFILDSLIELDKRGIDFRMIYCGSGGTDKKRLIKLINKNNLQNKIKVISDVSEEDLTDIYSRADLLLFPSFYDSDGIVKYEASNCETPSLVVQGATASIGIEDGVSGFIAENSPVLYADKIEQILSDKELLEKVGKQCAKYLVKSWDTIASEAVELYRQAIQKYNEKH